MKLPKNSECLICHHVGSQSSMYGHLKLKHKKKMILGTTYKFIGKNKAQKIKRKYTKQPPLSISYTDSSVMIRIPIIIGTPEIVK